MPRASVQTAPIEPPVVLIQPASGWPRIHVTELWAYRELLYFLVWRDVKVRYKQTIIGAGWAVIQPFFTMIVFTLFFGKLANIPSDGIPYPIFFFSALVPWTYFAAALQGSTNAIVDQQRLVTKVYFPRLVLPLAAALTPLVDFLIAFALLAGMAVYYGIEPSRTLLALPALMALAVVTALAAGIWLSTFNARYRDVRHAVPFLLQLWMFTSPVAYPSSLVPEGWRWLYGLNPMAGVIEGFRWAIVGQSQPPPALLLSVSTVVVLAVLGSGALYFRRMEGKIADVL